MIALALSGGELADHEPIEAVIDAACANGVRALELWHPKNTGDGSIGELSSRLARAGLRVACVATGSELCRAGGSQEDQQLLLEAIHLAAALSSPIVNTYFGHLDKRDDAAAIRAYCSMLRPCLAKAQEHDVIITLENEFNAFGEDPCESDVTRRPASLRTLVEAVDHPLFRLNFDAANFYCAGVEAFPFAFDVLSPYVRYCHFKNCRSVPSGANAEVEAAGWRLYEDYGRFYATTSLPDGAVPMDSLLRRLVSTGYTGYVTLEPHSQPSTRAGTWRDAVHFMSQILANARDCSLTESGPHTFHHVKLDVAEISRSLDFYVGVLGMSEIVRYDREDGVRIVQVSPTGQPPGIELWRERAFGRIADDRLHFALECSDVTRVVKRIREWGGAIEREPFRLGNEEIAFVRDPDGYLIELNNGRRS